MSTIRFDPTSTTGHTGDTQTWTVPASGWYRITATGAQGGGTHGGMGAKASAYVYLLAQQVLHIRVGQAGRAGSGRAAGGGGTYVVRQSATALNDVLVVAGGGGGYLHSLPASTERHGQAGTAGGGDNAGTDGNGGSQISSGGGFLTWEGSDISGRSYLAGSQGGSIFPDYRGGFGGGGSPSNVPPWIQGGGGGFSGGGHLGGINNDLDNTGGGGGSVIYTDNDFAVIIPDELQSGFNTSAGYVDIDFLAPNPAALPDATLAESRVISLGGDTPRVCVFDWHHPQKAIFPTVDINGYWSTAVPRQWPFGIYYLSQDPRNPPIVHGPYTET